MVTRSLAGSRCVRWPGRDSAPATPLILAVVGAVVKASGAGEVRRNQVKDGNNVAPLAQLDRAAVFGTAGCRFEPCRAYCGKWLLRRGCGWSSERCQERREGQMCLLRLGGEDAEYLTLKVHGRNTPGSADYWDGNWLSCTAEVSAGAFRGALRGLLRNDDLAGFLLRLEQLHRRLDAEARLDTLDGWLDVRLAGDGRGHI